jgi:structural maintenance of chromosome 4
MAASTQNRVLDALTALKHTGRIKGFHGRLGSLGTIPEKYDVAVTTACGSLNNMVVDTVDQGQNCIEYLRQQNVGRASFIVLEKVGEHLPGMKKIPTPEDVPRLYDLIAPKDPRFAAAFYKGVQDTLVAADLEQANRIAFGGQRRWRVVTLAGQLIDASGTMSGGGSAPQRGGMSAKLQAEAVPPDALRRFEQDSDAAARELEGVLEELRALEGAVAALSQAGPQLETSLTRIQLEIQAKDRELADATKRAKHLRYGPAAALLSPRC